MSTRTDLARLKITLEEVKPCVERRVVVRLGIRLDQLHAVIQAAMGWSNGHLWELRAAGAGWGPRIPDDAFGDGPLDATKATLLDVLEDAGTRTLTYLYDFGDGWRHKIKLERIFDGVPGLETPFLLEAKGRCPPEDIGGPSGYADFLSAMAAPDDPRHAEWINRFPAGFDPSTVETGTIEARLETLAKRWTRTPKPHKRKPS